MCCTWLPLALPQKWPFCYWVSVAIDHFSRRAMGATATREQPTSSEIRAFLGRTIAKAKQTPKYIICDRGAQFDCGGFRDWCSRKGIKPRYGAIGKHGSIAVVERFILTLKTLLRCMFLMPYLREAMQRELNLATGWYNSHRPHTWLGGKTPDEVYQGEFPANRRPRFEPRPRWPRGSPCARPWALVRGSPAHRFELKVKFFNGRKHLPVVSLVRTHEAARPSFAQRSRRLCAHNPRQRLLLFSIVKERFAFPTLRVGKANRSRHFLIKTPLFRAILFPSSSVVKVRWTSTPAFRRPNTALSSSGIRAIIDLSKSLSSFLAISS